MLRLLEKSTESLRRLVRADRGVEEKLFAADQLQGESAVSGEHRRASAFSRGQIVEPERRLDRFGFVAADEQIRHRPRRRMRVMLATIIGQCRVVVARKLPGS